MQGKAALDYHMSGRGREEGAEEEEEMEGRAALIHAGRPNINIAA